MFLLERYQFKKSLNLKVVNEKYFKLECFQLEIFQAQRLPLGDISNLNVFNWKNFKHNGFQSEKILT